MCHKSKFLSGYKEVLSKHCFEYLELSHQRRGGDNLGPRLQNISLYSLCPQISGTLGRSRGCFNSLSSAAIVQHFGSGNTEQPRIFIYLPASSVTHNREAIYQTALSCGVLGKPLTSVGNMQEEAKTKLVWQYLSWSRKPCHAVSVWVVYSNIQSL